MEDYIQSFKELQVWHSELSKCVRCGACRAVCPTFSVIQREIASPRGKISLCQSFTEGAIDLSPKFIRAVRECLTCAACRENCPNSVDVPSLILAVRNEIFRKKGLPFCHLLLDRMLASRFAGSLAFKSASIFQGLLFKGLPEYSGFHLRFPLPFVDRERLIPPLAGRPFLESIESRVENSELRTDSLHSPLSTLSSPLSTLHSLRVGIFVGCLVDYVMPEIGEATLNLLEKAGAEVVTPMEQMCCGMPALSMGDRETAKELAMRNLEVFASFDLDFIVTPCATCATALKLHFRELLKDENEEIKRKVEDFTSKTREVTEFLMREIPNPKSQIPNPRLIVTYHDPCHMSRYLRIKDEPRELIEGAGYRFVEMSHPCRCCGLGGQFSIDNYDISREIGKDKALDIAGTEADIVATACPGCIIQLRDALHHIGMGTDLKSVPRVVHVVELLEC